MTLKGRKVAKSFSGFLSGVSLFSAMQYLSSGQFHIFRIAYGSKRFLIQNKTKQNIYVNRKKSLCLKLHSLGKCFAISIVMKYSKL